MSIKVFLVDDHDIVRQGIKALLESEPGIEIIGEARNGADACEALKTNLPTIVLLDMNMPVMNGSDCTRKIKKEFPGVKVMILSMHDHENYLIDMLDAGADGYILKNSCKEDMIAAIKIIANNGIFIGPEFTLSMLSKYKATLGFESIPKTDLKLSDREKAVLDLVADGLTNSEIAQKLFTSVRTIETRRKNLLEKTGTTNTATLIRFSVLNGLVK